MVLHYIMTKVANLLLSCLASSKIDFLKDVESTVVLKPCLWCTDKKRLSRNMKKRTCRLTSPAKIRISLRKLIRIISGRMLDSQECETSSYGKGKKLWSDHADAQADARLPWTYILVLGIGQNFIGDNGFCKTDWSSMNNWLIENLFTLNLALF